VRELADRAGLDPNTVMQGKVPTTGVLRYAATVSPGISPLFAWQLCSGFSHGRPWAALGALDREVMNTSEDGVLVMKQTNSLDRALYPVSVAHALLQTTMGIVHRRCTP
jgi:hypothetical protein